MPIFDVYSEAPTVAAASCLANSAAPALTEYLKTLAHDQGSTAPLVRVQTLGTASASVVNGARP